MEDQDETLPEDFLFPPESPEVDETLPEDFLFPPESPEVMDLLEDLCEETED